MLLLQKAFLFSHLGHNELRDRPMKRPLTYSSYVAVFLMEMHLSAA